MRSRGSVSMLNLKKLGSPSATGARHLAFTQTIGQRLRLLDLWLSMSTVTVLRPGTQLVSCQA